MKKSLKIVLDAFDALKIHILIICASDMRVAAANKAALSSLGYEGDELINLPVQNLISFQTGSAKSVFDSILTGNLTKLPLSATIVKKDYLTLSLDVTVTNFQSVDGLYFVITTTENNDTVDILNRISDGFTLFDRDWNYVFINKRAAELIGRDPKEIIGKNLFKEFSHWIGSPLYHDYLRAMEEQRMIKTEAYFPEYDKFFEGVLYPSPNGLSVYLQDVTDRKKAEIARDESQELYRTIVETAQEGILKIDENNTITFVNTYVASILGCTSQHLIGKNVLDIVGEDNVEATLQSINRKKEGLSRQYELGISSSTGKAIDILVRSRPLFKGGNYSGSISTILDITERKQAEKRLSESEKRFKSLFEHSQDGIALLSAEAIILDVSPAIEKILGFTKEELINTSRLDFVIPEDVPIIHAAFGQVIKNAAIAKTVEYRAVLRDGSRKWIECTFSNLLHEPAVNAIVLNFRDITSRKGNEQQILESERKYRQIVETALEGIWMIDEEFKTTFVNQKMCDLLEYTQEEMLGRTTISFRKDYDLKQILERRELRKQGMSETHESDFVSKTGKVIHVKVCTNPIFDVSGNFKGSLAMVTDITYLKRAEEEKEFERRNKEALINSTGDLIWSVAKDYTLITANRAFLNAMKTRTGIELKQGDFLLSLGEYRDDYLKIWKNFYDRGLKGESFSEEIKLASKTDGDSTWLEVTYNPVHNNDEIVAVACFSRDITEKKRAAEQLRESEEKYRTIIETTQEGVWQLDENNKTCFVNDFMASLLGYTKEEMMGSSLFDHMDEQGKTEVEGLLELRKKGMAEQHEFNFLRKNKTLVNTILQSTPICRDGKYAGALAMVIDNTQRKQAEEKLVASERRFRSLIEKSTDGILLSSVEGIITYASRSAGRIIDLPGNEICGKHFLEFVEPEFHAPLITTSAKLRNEPSISLTIEYQIKSPKGQQKWVESTSTNLLNDPAINAVVINVRDITERKIAEEKIRFKADLLNTIGQAVVATDQEGLVTYWNSAAEKIYGWLQEEALGKSLMVLTLAEQSGEQAIETKKQLFKRKSWSGELIVQRKDKSTFPASVNDSPIEDEKGNFAGIIRVSSDITEAKKNENQLNESETRYRIAKRQGRLGHWELNLTNNKLYWSDEIYKMFKVSKDFRDLDFDFFVSCVHPHDRPSVLQKIEYALANKKGYELYHRVLLKDGSIRHFQEVADIVLDDEGNPVKVMGMVQDVTAQKKAEQQILITEGQLKIIYDNVSDVIFLLNIEDKDKYKFASVNKQFLETTGLTEDLVVGKYIDEVLPPSSVKLVLQKYRDAIENRRTISWEEIAQYPSGLKTGYVTIAPVADEKGKPTLLVGSVHDITEQKNAEQRIIESEEKYRILFEKSPMPMWIFEMEAYRILEVNGAAINHYGYSKDEFHTLTLFDIRPQEERAQLKELHNFRHTETMSFETIHKKKSGELINVTVTASPIEFENKRAKLTVIVDRTEEERTKVELIESRNELRNLATHLENIREDERTYIAREIHDELGQQLTGLKMDISWINRNVNIEEEKVKRKIQSAVELADIAIGTVRKIATQLRPSILDDLGVSEAIDWQARDFSNRTGITVSFSSNAPDVKFPPAISIAMFRIFQEALTNVARHANASKITSTLNKKDNSIVLVISDNGIGFNEDEQKSRKTLGLLGMKERVIALNGNYHISSRKGMGTVVTVEVPLNVDK